MSNPRASIFADDEVDVSGFVPKSGPDKSAPPPDQVKAVAEAARFLSREPIAPTTASAAKRPPRRYRTGRNVQFNVKASQETVEAFYAISDLKGWVLGETLEHALAALQREIEQNEAGTS